MAVKYVEFTHKVNKADVPVCDILGVRLAVTDMQKLVEFTEKNLKDLSGDYYCFSNVHTAVMAHDDRHYRMVQNGGAIAAPDGGPLSYVGRRRGYADMQRVAGPSFMEEIFAISGEKGYRHYFYGATQETLDKMREKLEREYPDLVIAGMYSPPFRRLTDEEDCEVVRMINDAHPDFVWVGLGAPKQEIWMARHRGRVDGLMAGVGAAFDYYAENIKRAPLWMQSCNLEWLYRLAQNPKKLFRRYLYTNLKFLWLIYVMKK
ncbi:MAG: WecB/TagA/CpsF family glycosyltransferase [Lachnospiraceae bacterium]|nr:WecB/TagA/CpsF family glycosyltransferase [Lachnospiraceae bacterium]